MARSSSGPGRRSRLGGTEINGSAGTVTTGEENFCSEK